MNVYEQCYTLDKNGNTKKERKMVLNPTPLEKWFYAIERRNTDALNDMLREGFAINSMNIYGETLSHLCLKSSKLLQFALDNKVCFKQKTLDGTEAITDIFFYYCPTDIFKKAIDYHGQDFVNDISYSRHFAFLATYDENLAKIKFLFNKYSIDQTLKEQMIDASIEAESREIWKFLTGRGKLMQRLSQKMPSKDNAIVQKI